GKRAKAAAAELAAAPTGQKNRALETIAQALLTNSAEILKANALDVEAARRAGMKEAFIERLTLTEGRVKGMAEGIREIIRLEDPVGKIDGGSTRPNGLKIVKTRVPLGVLGIIYESRPNVTADAAALCLKSGNAVILRGGPEALNSNLCLTQIMRNTLEQNGLNKDCCILLEDTSLETAREMMRLNGYIDVLIPRGGPGLIKAVLENATVPCIETGVGNCHLFIDKSAEIEQAVSITDNAKTSRPSVCNALETLLVHREIAPVFLPRVKQALDKHKVELRGCPVTRNILGPAVVPVSEEDYFAEFGDYILAVKVVDGLEEAAAHISKYSSKHSDGIVTGDYAAVENFVKNVDAAAVYVNASTRFTDGGEFGMGAEIGISTQKLHARGPMGLLELTSNKYIVYGSGQIRV
ncbi:MAG: glutamate-5-semialdehyde dehydrogenase, partial [Clostridiales bacterium]|nr:glutamate-5-semialdehyde dehydrogenase [Clostridiales bacterium]